MLPGMRHFLARSGPVRAFRELRRDFSGVVFVLATGDLVASFGFSLVFPFLTIYLVQAFGATAFEAGLVIAGYSLCSIVSGAAGGWLADRVGRRPVMIVSVGITGLVVVLMGQAGDLAQIAILTVVLGMIDPAFIPAARAAIADVVPEERRPRAYGLLAVAASVGWIAGPAIGAGLSRLGYPLLFAIAGVIIALYALIALRWLPETRPAVDRVAAAMGAGPVPAADPPREARIPGGARRSVRPPVVLAAFLPLTMIIHAATFLWVTNLPIAAARDLGVSTGAWGLLFSLNGIIIVTFQLRVAGAAERRPKPRMMALAALFYAGSYLLASAASPAAAVAVLGGVIVVATVGEMLLFPIEPSFVSDLSPEDQRGRYQGIALAAAALGSAVGPPVGGWILDASPGPLTWWVAAAALGLCAGGFLLLSRLAARLPRASPIALPIGGTPGAPDVAT